MGLQVRREPSIDPHAEDGELHTGANGSDPPLTRRIGDPLVLSQQFAKESQPDVVAKQFDHPDQGRRENDELLKQSQQDAPGCGHGGRKDQPSPTKTLGAADREQRSEKELGKRARQVTESTNGHHGPRAKELNTSSPFYGTPLLTPEWLRVREGTSRA
jgi:hypothetical protein